MAVLRGASAGRREPETPSHGNCLFPTLEDTICFYGCSGIWRHRRTDVSQGNTLEQYTTLVHLPQRHVRPGGEDGQSVARTVEKPSQAEILAAIQGSRVALEGKIETLAVEVNLLRADLRKVSDKVKVVEGSIMELQTEVGALRKQMVQPNSMVRRLEASLEDAEGCSLRNNIRLMGFLEREVGSATETFVENWIKDVLQPVGLSRVFVIEQAHGALVAPP
ncbi:hypothetical protein NDU88_010759 [Pleurodeles waltl]|uniref:Uncharacterized protein n=1 Tax=Pleurodeles waltl TaxID=8319 RepID=A0AAV7QYV3_PLEWA|nr:hypothetical protein NDU88_010759 [Pleurodeles waltl]